VYRLVGINIHEGTADAGHYYSIINTKRGSEEIDPYKEEEKWNKVELNPWKEFNDASISIFSFDKNIEKEAFGGDQTSKSSGTTDAMSDADLANFLSSGSGSYGKSAYMLFYERKKKHNLTEYTDDEQKETKIIDYRNVEKSVPDWISEMVKNDNKSFLVDQQVFDD
jgi:ubiquitin carboxyl-terminal hydrolase 34